MPIMKRARGGHAHSLTTVIAVKDKADAKQSDANPDYLRPFKVLPRTKCCFRLSDCSGEDQAHRMLRCRLENIFD
jgi:hypothetical protein